MKQIVERIRGVRKNMSESEVLIKRSGFERSEDSWESVKTMVEDIRGIIENYIDTTGERNLKRERLDFYF